MIRRVLLFCIICVLCLGGNNSLLAQEPTDKTGKDNVPSLTNPDRYRIQPNDVLDVQYRYTPEYNDIVTVQPDGFVTLPLIGDVKVSGLTIDQIRKTLAEKAAVRLREPELTVKLKEFEKPSFVISGQVKNPGRFDLRGKVMVSEAIAIAGGFIDSSYTSQVLLFRKLNAEWSEVIEVNLKDDKNQRKRLMEDLSLRPGDMLFVPQNKLSKFERIVKNVAPFNPMNVLYILYRR